MFGDFDDLTFVLDKDMFLDDLDDSVEDMGKEIEDWMKDSLVCKVLYVDGNGRITKISPYTSGKAL